MAKEELIQLEGLVTEILPDARYRVQLDAGQVIIAYTAGKMKKNRIKTLAGDRVTVGMPPYDLEKSRTTPPPKRPPPPPPGPPAAAATVQAEIAGSLPRPLPPIRGAVQQSKP